MSAEVVPNSKKCDLCLVYNRYMKEPILKEEIKGKFMFFKRNLPDSQHTGIMYELLAHNPQQHLQ